MFKWIALHRLAPSFRVATRKRLTDYYTPSGPNVYTRRFVWSISLDTRLNRLPNANPTTCIRHTRDCTWNCASNALLCGMHNRAYIKNIRIYPYIYIYVCNLPVGWTREKRPFTCLAYARSNMRALSVIYMYLFVHERNWIFSYSLRALRGSPSSKIPLKIRIT